MLKNSRYREKSELIFLKKEEILLIDPNFLYVYVVLEGNLQVGKKFYSQHTVTVGFLGQNDWFSLHIHLPTEQKYQLKAISVTTILILEWSIFAYMQNTNNRFNIFVFAALNKRICQLEELTAILSPKSIDSRTIALILFLSKYWGRYTKRGVEVELSMSHKLISEILATSRVSITRVLKKLQQTKLIEFNKSRIFLTNPVFIGLLYRVNSAR